MRKITKILSVLLSVILVLTSVPVVIGTAETSEDDFDYRVLDDGTAEITGYSGSDTEITIPSKIGEYTVTSIGNYAFESCDSLTSVTIEDGVTNIGDSAFEYCDSLTSVTIPASVTSIGVSAFYGCYSLSSIKIDENNQNYSNDEYGVLFNKDKTELIQYPVGNKRTEYSIPDGVMYVGDEAFHGCASLTDVTIPNSVTDVGDYAFYSCTSLTSVTIPDSVTYIGDCAFGYYSFDVAGECVKVEGFTIYGIPGSAAEAYANENGFVFKVIGSETPTEPPAEMTTEAPTKQPTETPTKPATSETTTSAPADESTTAQPSETTTKTPAETTTEPTTEPVNPDIVITDKNYESFTLDDNVNGLKIGDGNTVKDVLSGVANENVKIYDKDGNELKEDSLVGTGAKVQIRDKDGNVLSEYTVLVPMDTTGDGEIEASDARVSLRSSAKLEVLDGVFSLAADTDGDKEIKASDARKILRVSAKLDKI